MADVSYQPGNRCGSLSDFIRSRGNNVPTLVVLVSGDAEGDDNLSLLRIQNASGLQRSNRLPRQVC